MKTIFFISLLVLSIRCTTTRNTSSNNAGLDGTWVPVKEEMGGSALPDAAFKNQQLSIKDSTYTVTAESVDKGVVRLNGDKMDIYGRNGVNAGKHFTALYKYEAGQLTICYNLAGDAYPESFDTQGKPLYFLSVFKRK